MERLKRAIYATAMNERIMKAYEEIDNEDLAECMLNDWLANGVPDGNTLVDNIEDFGSQEDYNELVDTFLEICENYDIKWKVFYKEVEEIKKNIVEMLDNPYHNML